jgi:hypothetical protein
MMDPFKDHSLPLSIPYTECYAMLTIDAYCFAIEMLRRPKGGPVKGAPRVFSLAHVGAAEP